MFSLKAIANFFNKPKAALMRGMRKPLESPKRRSSGVQARKFLPRPHITANADGYICHVMRLRPRHQTKLICSKD